MAQSVNLVHGVNNVPVLADTIEIHKGDLQCIGIDFGRKNVIFCDDVYYKQYYDPSAKAWVADRPKIEYLQNGVIVNEDCSNLFQGDDHLDLFDMDFKNVTGASNMFNNCIYLTKITAKNVDKIQNASLMFNMCSRLKEVSIPSFSSVTGASYMFNNCVALQTVDIPDIYATDIEGMFSNCLSLQDVNIGTIHENTSLQDLSFRKINPIFNHCANLRNVTFQDILPTGKVDLNVLSNGSMSSLTIGNVAAAELLSMPSVKCDSLKIGRLPNLTEWKECSINAKECEIGDMPNVSAVSNMIMFKQAPQLKNLKIGNMNSVSAISGFGAYLSNLETLSVGDMSALTAFSCDNTANIISRWYGRNIKKVSFGKMPSLKNINYMLSDCTKLTEFSAENLKPTNMKFAFYNTSLSAIPDIDYSDVTDMNGAFWGTRIKNIDFEFLNSGGNMANLFAQCQELKSANVRFPNYVGSSSSVDAMFGNSLNCEEINISLPKAYSVGQISSTASFLKKVTANLDSITYGNLTVMFGSEIRELTLSIKNKTDFGDLATFRYLKKLDLYAPNAVSGSLMHTNACQELILRDINGLTGSISCSTSSLPAMKYIEFDMSQLGRWPFSVMPSMPNLTTVKIKGLNCDLDLSKASELEDITYLAENAKTVDSAKSIQLSEFTYDNNPDNVSILQSKGFNVVRSSKRATAGNHHFACSKPNSVILINGESVQVDENGCFDVPEASLTASALTFSASGYTYLTDINFSSDNLVSLNPNYYFTVAPTNIIGNLPRFSGGSFTLIGTYLQTLSGDLHSFPMSLKGAESLKNIDIKLNSGCSFAECAALENVKLDCEFVSDFKYDILSMCVNVKSLELINTDSIVKLSRTALFQGITLDNFELSLPNATRAECFFACKCDEIHLTCENSPSISGLLYGVTSKEVHASYPNATSGAQKCFNTNTDYGRSISNLYIDAPKLSAHSRPLIAESSIDTLDFTGGCVTLNSILSGTNKLRRLHLNMPLCTSVNGPILSNYSSNIIEDFSLVAPKATNLSSMCYGLGKVTDVSIETIEPITTCNYTFYGCSSLTDYSRALPDMSNVTFMDAMFCRSGIISFKANLPSVVSMTSAFSYCNLLSEVSITANSISAIPSDFVDNCPNLEYLTISADNATNVVIPSATQKTLVDLRLYCKSIGNVNFNFKDAKSLSYAEIIFPNCSYLNYSFSGLSNLSTLKLAESMPNVTSLNNTCRGCSALDEFKCNLPNVKSVSSAFNGCANLKRVDLGEANITDSAYSFEGCASLSSITVSVSGNTSISALVPTTLRGNIIELNIAHLNSTNDFSVYENLQSFSYIAEHADNVTGQTLTVSQKQADSYPDAMDAFRSKGFTVSIKAS